MPINERAMDEICWIVTQRNKWAYERHVINRTVKRIRKKKNRSDSEREILKASLNRLKQLKNVEQKRLNSYTQRLRKLLRENPGVDLVRSHLGGYKYIEIFSVDETNSLHNFVMLDALDMRKRSDLFEAAMAIENLIG